MTAAPTVEDVHLYRAFPAKPLEVERAEGAYLYTTDGRRIIDLGGANHGTANLGHSHPRVVKAIQEQSQRVIHVTANVPNPARGEFLEALHDALPGHFETSFLCNSGTEAVEAAMKFAITKTGRKRFVSTRNAFHGRTLGALGATWRPQYRQPFEGATPAVDFVPYNDEGELADAVNGEIAAVIVEPVQGEGGVVPAADGYLEAAQRIARENGALLIVDEIQTGIGRTGFDFAVQASACEPDVLLLGKSIAGGVPMGVVAMTREVAQSMPPGGHGTTFGGAPLACAAGRAALDVLREEALSERAAQLGERFMHRLQSIKSPLIRQIRGRGLMIGVDLRVKPAQALADLLEAGFLALPAATTTIRFLPPLVINETDLMEAADELERILARLEAAVAPS